MCCGSMALSETPREDQTPQEGAMVQGPQPLMNPNLDDLPPAEREFGPVANVWWSQRANDEHWLRQMRPSDLPSLQSGDSGPMPGERGDHSGDQENRGLMSGSVSSPGHGFTALENRVTADAARVSGEMGSLGHREPEYFNLATDDSAAGSSERFQDIDDAQPCAGVYGLGTGAVQQQLHYSSNPGAGTARMSQRAGEWFGSAPPSATRLQPSSAMSFGPQGYPSQSSGYRSSGLQRTVADAAAGNAETVHSFGLQLDHQIRNAPARDLYGMFEQEGRCDPMLLGLIRRLEEAEARARFASTTQSVADLSGSTGKVPMYRSGPKDETRSITRLDTLPTGRVASVGDSFVGTGLEAGRYGPSAGPSDHWTSGLQASVPKVGHDCNFENASGVPFGNWPGFLMRGPSGAREGEQGINPDRNSGFRVEQGPGLGQARSNDFADVGGFTVDSHTEPSRVVAVMPQVVREAAGVGQGWQSSGVELQKPGESGFVTPREVPSLIGDGVFGHLGEGRKGLNERSEVVASNRIWDEPISLLDLDPIPIMPASSRPTQVPLIDILSPKSHRTTPFVPLTPCGHTASGTALEPPRTPRVGTSLGHACTPGGTRIPDGPPPCTPPGKSVSFGETIPIPHRPFPVPQHRLMVCLGLPQGSLSLRSRVSWFIHFQS